MSQTQPKDFLARFIKTVTTLDPYHPIKQQPQSASRFVTDATKPVKVKQEPLPSPPIEPPLSPLSTILQGAAAAALPVKIKVEEPVIEVPQPSHPEQTITVEESIPSASVVERTSKRKARSEPQLFVATPPPVP